MLLFLWNLFKALLAITGMIILIIIGMFLGSISVWHKTQDVPKNNHQFPDNEVSLTWIGHSTVLINLNGVKILTDPMYNDYILYLAKRYYEPAIPFDKLPKIDIVVISHEHYDHIDKYTLRKLPKDTPVILRKGNSKRVIEAGIENIIELDWWEDYILKSSDSVKITAVPAQHGRSNACGFVIESDSTSIYFAGDTGYFDGIKEIGKKFDINVALLPISHYKTPRGRKRTDAMLKRIHMGPPDFPQVIKDLSAGLAIPIHHSTFRNVGILELPLKEPENHLRRIREEENLQDKIKIWQIGEKIRLK